MGENPSSPEDGLEDALRRALSDAVGGIEPGRDGLDSIRARIGQRPPRPWLLAVLSGAVERVRFWTWRGHWAWPWRPLARAHLPWRARRPRHRKGAPADKPSRRGDTFPLLGTLGGRFGWLWLTAGLVGIVVIASVSFGVQPVRQVFIQAGSTVLHGGDPDPPRSGAGTDGAGAQATTDGPGALADGGVTGNAQPSPTSASGSRGGPGATAPGTGSSACQPPASGSPGEPTPTPADSGTTPSTWWWAGGTASQGAGQTASPPAADSTWSPDQPTATPDSTATSALTCAVTPGTSTATPTVQPGVTGTSATPTSTTSDGTTPADTTPTSTTSDGTDTSTATADPTGTGSAPATGSAAADQGDSTAALAGSDSWRWYGRLGFSYDDRRPSPR